MTARRRGAQAAPARPNARLDRAIARTLAPGERVIIACKPALGSIPLRALGLIALVIAVFVLTRLALTPWIGPATARVAELLALIALMARLGWEALVWLSRSYALTDRRVVAVVGVLRRLQLDLPLAHIQHVALYRSIRERLAGLGSLLFATAGTARTEVAWSMVWAPQPMLRTVRTQIELPRVRGNEQPARHTPLVIGLAGGIGAGKSTVARAFAELGCVVVDSDALAREALQRPEVRDALVSWWGGAVLDEQGRVDRKAVASIVFKDPAERTRLEGLIHPLVRKSRAELIAHASGAPAVIVDAPLLFEAGVDTECDAVIFVDTPRAVRLERVERTRGWDAAELARREASQLPVEAKRARSQLVIDASGSLEAIADQARRALESLRHSVSNTPSPGPGRSGPVEGT